MLQESIYDLLVASPHEPDDARFTAAEFRVYRAGYSHALTIALRTMEAAERRYKVYILTRRLETARRNKEARESQP